MANLTATAAVLYEVKKPLVIEEVELLEPGPTRCRSAGSPTASATATFT